MPAAVSHCWCSVPDRYLPLRGMSAGGLSVCCCCSRVLAMPAASSVKCCGCPAFAHWSSLPVWLLACIVACSRLQVYQMYMCWCQSCCSSADDTRHARNQDSDPARHQAQALLPKHMSMHTPKLPSILLHTCLQMTPDTPEIQTATLQDIKRKLFYQKTMV